MDSNNEKQACTQLTAYITDQLGEMDRHRYERHLDTCMSCKRDVGELREAWNSLPYTAPIVEPPQDLKEQVMSGIFSEPTRAFQPISSRHSSRRSYGFYSICTAVIVVILMGTIWNYQLTAERQHIARAQAEWVDQPTVIENLFPLSAQSDSASTKAYGVACIAKQGEQSELVVYVYNAVNNQGDQAYQVWLVRDTERTNAGTFQVGDDGVGVLTYRMNEKANFDAIGITLEPDSKGTAPRGEKIFGNSDQIIWN
jgi:hypothetical protein